MPKRNLIYKGNGQDEKLGKYSSTRYCYISILFILEQITLACLCLKFRVLLLPPYTKGLWKAWAFLTPISRNAIDFPSRPVPPAEFINNISSIPNRPRDSPSTSKNRVVLVVGEG